MLLPEAVLMSMVSTAARNQVKPMIHAATDCEVQGSSFAVVAMSADSQFVIRDVEGFCDNSPQAPKRNSLDSKPLKRTP